MTTSLLEDINMMACVHNLFAILQQAAWAIFLSVPRGKWLKDILPNILNKSIYLDDTSNGVVYGSTGEILPGIYIRHILSDYTLFSEDQEIGNNAAAFINEDFFNKHQRKDRVLFFNLFHTYSRLVPPIKTISSMNTIRSISHQDIYQFYINTLQNRSFIRASLLNIFLLTRDKNLSKTEESQIMNYFKDNSIVVPESHPLNITIDVFGSYQDKELGDYNFYINPCTYRTIKVMEQMNSDSNITTRSIYRPPTHSQKYEDIYLDNIFTPGLTEARI